MDRGREAYISGDKILTIPELSIFGIVNGRPWLLKAGNK